jgi:choline dehydrogenase
VKSMFDYVVVGAGSAGCVVASRLVEDPSVRVLLLEAGGSDHQREIAMPVAFSRLFKTPVDWAYLTEPQAHLHQRMLYWPRGKVLGGSSSINAMVYIRGHRADYDTWRDEGNEGWGFSDVLPYFKKAEHQERGASEFHGVGGPLNVANLRSPNPLSRAFVQACVQLGIPHNDDFNGATQDGVGLYQVNQKNGRRHSTAAAYLQSTRQNLTILTGAYVTRVLFSGTRATGVEIIRERQIQRIEAGSAVILCGGAINSPQVLMLSGVGPAQHLRQFNIPVVVDLPGVGQNLQDHLVIGAVYVCRRPVSLDGAGSLADLLRFLVLRRGRLTSNVGEAGGFVRTDAAAPLLDLQLMFGPVYFLDHGLTHPAGHGFSLGGYLLRPRSKGYVALRSSHPLAPPVIQPNYLADEHDLSVLVEGFRLVRRIARAKAFDASRGREYWPGEHVQSTEETVEAIRESAETHYHPVGTCKMGRDAGSVVDAQLRVHSVEGLRVVDASIMPTIVGGNTNAPVIMIAEKAADMIKG